MSLGITLNSTAFRLVILYVNEAPNLVSVSLDNLTEGLGQSSERHVGLISSISTSLDISRKNLPSKPLLFPYLTPNI